MRPISILLATALISAAPAYAETGTASWYGMREHGHPMADGHPFNALGVNAASRKYPLGTKLRITNLANDKSTYVSIEDRGPYIKSRILDVSLGTARILGFEHQGLARVRIEPVAPVVAPVVYRYHVRPVHHRRTKHHRHAAK